MGRSVLLNFKSKSATIYILLKKRENLLYATLNKERITYLPYHISLLLLLEIVPDVLQMLLNTQYLMSSPSKILQLLPQS